MLNKFFFDDKSIENYHGNSAEGVHLWIENGLITKAIADKGEDFLHAMINMDDGSHGIGEIAIGTNEEIQEITGNILFDEKISGSLHFTPGCAYEDADNTNRSAVHWDLVLIQD